MIKSKQQISKYRKSISMFIFLTSHHMDKKEREEKGGGRRQGKKKKKKRKKKKRKKDEEEERWGEDQSRREMAYTVFSFLKYEYIFILV